MDIDKNKYEHIKKCVEDDLRSYPYWLIAIEAPGLGYPTNWSSIKEKSNNFNYSFVESSVLGDFERTRKVEIITQVLTKLDKESKKIIEEWYFRDTTNREELEKELGLDKNKFYYFRNRTLKKFMIALGYI